MLPLRISSVFLAALLVCGCGSSRLSVDYVEESIRMQHDQWQGTPFRLGGESRSGIDCSAFVMKVFESSFGITLPRTTMEQLAVGEPVDKGELTAGDLVFFRTSGTDRHVGVYLSDNRFVHASNRDGVTTSSLDAAFWQAKYWTARRILATDESAARTPQRPPSTQRTGW